MFKINDDNQNQMKCQSLPVDVAVHIAHQKIGRERKLNQITRYAFHSSLDTLLNDTI